MKHSYAKTNNGLVTTIGPCKLIGPKFEKFADEYAGIAYAQVDVDAVPVCRAKTYACNGITLTWYNYRM